MHQPVPRELVDMIIDDVGSGRVRVHRPPLKEGGDESCALTYETLKSCALVARSWTYRSRMNLFKAIVLSVNEEEGVHDLVLPSRASLHFVKFLEIYVNPANPHRGPITLHLLTVFSACPLQFLQINGGLFSLSARPAFRTCFGALYGRLLDLTFRFCLFESEPLRDVLTLGDTRADVMFIGCDQAHPGGPARDAVVWEPVRHTSHRKLCVMGTEEKPSEEFLIGLSLLSVQFCQLEVDFYEDGELADATQSLLDANAGAMTFLKLNVISDTFVDQTDNAEALLPPSLSRCVNLSELVLNMKGSYSCVVETPGAIFATLLETNCPNLFKITLEVEDARSLFLAESRDEFLDSWKGLDATLTMLAERSMTARGSKLVFVMEVTCEDKTIRRAKKWLPRLLPTFVEEGLLHVHDGEDDVCRGRNSRADNERACMGRAVLARYAYESESDGETEESGGGNDGNQSAEGHKGSEKDEELDEENE